MLLNKSSFSLEDVSQAPQQCEIEGRRKQTKLSAIIYKCMYDMLRVRDRNFMWLKYVKHILCNCGFNYIWESQTFINELWLKHSIKQKSH